MRIDKGRCYCRNRRIVYKEADGWGVLIDPYRRTLVRLNPAAQRIWELLDGSHSCTDVIEDLITAFEVDAQTLERDVIGFLNSLVMREMIE